MEEPILELRSSKVASGDYLRPNRVLIYADRIEEVKPNFVRKRHDAIPIRQVAQVVVRNGVMWAELVIESAGGHTIIVEGLDKGRAAQARSVIYNLVNGASPGLQVVNNAAPVPATPVPDPLDQLTRLGALRDSGVLTQEEFETEKARILGTQRAAEGAPATTSPAAAWVPVNNGPGVGEKAVKQVGAAVSRFRERRRARGEDEAEPDDATGGEPAAWRSDPTGRHELRYWDGTDWTDHVADQGAQGTDPYAHPVERNTDEETTSADADHDSDVEGST